MMEREPTERVGVQRVERRERRCVRARACVRGRGSEAKHSLEGRESKAGRGWVGGGVEGHKIDGGLRTWGIESKVRMSG